VLEALVFRPDVVLSGHIVGLPATLTMEKLLGVPFVQYVHGAELTVRPGLARAACRSAAAVIAVSRYTMGLVHGLGTPVPVHLIPPGVDADAPPRRSHPRLPIVLTVSRLDNLHKGHDVLLRALPLIRARVPGVSLVVIGDGALRPVYEAMAEAIGLRDAVRFLGSVDEAERDRWYGEAAVFVMVSRLTPGGGEGFGIVYLEAALHGLPVVAGGVGGARDAVRDGVTGLLVDPEDHVEVAEAVTRILTDGSYARGLSLAAARHARRYAWPAIGAQVREVLLPGAERVAR
jgi:phosphatidylinositol alpha-1,6-mannosyltransferase